MNNSSRRYRHLALWVGGLSERYPKSYLGFTLVLMALGYVFIFMFPYFAFASISILIEQLATVPIMQQSAMTWVWVSVLIVCSLVSWQIFKLHFPRTQGLKLSRQQVPELFELVAGVGKFTLQPAVRNIVLTGQYELRIEQTPRFGFPFCSNNTLVLGLPMLQTLSEEQFRCELMHRLSQYASGRFRPSHWVFRTRLLWRRYLDALTKNKRFGDFPIRWFFAVYTPLFELLTLPAVRADELAGDSTVLEWVNDRDYFDALMSSTFASLFLEGHYWRQVYQTALKNSKSALTPFADLEHISGHLNSKEFRRKWLQGAFAADQNYSKAMPTLRTRMENIGQSKLRVGPIIENTAAQILLGDARKNIVSIIDKLWCSTTFMRWKTEHRKHRENVKTVKEISRKSRRKIVSVTEVLHYARLVKQLRGDSLRSSYAKMFKRNLRNSLPFSLN
ncbi:hypothetical protein JYT26_01620 [Beggiatoa alba]|nr:hypothetical protein [Beggiatoa alba]